MKGRAVEAIALLKRVRRKGNSPTELDWLCALTNLDKGQTEQHLASVKEAPGFVERGALYYRVTPELIAMIAFAAAWKRWVEGREDEFLSALPEGIQQSFLERVSESANSQVRNTVQSYFRRFADTFAPGDLADVGSVKKLISLIETDPVAYLPTMKRAISSATHDDLTGGTAPAGDWGPRRQMVWLAERFAIFPEFFSDCQQMLFILAQHECEPNIGNNATGTWQQLFRMQLSGTAVPFGDRLDILRNHIRTADDSTADLVAGALERILDVHGTRLLGPPVIGGRIPPADWHPRNWPEVRDSIKAALRLINEAVSSNIPVLSHKARRTLLSDIEVFARQGWVDDLRTIVRESSLDESDRARLSAKLKHFLALHAAGSGGANSENDKKLEVWIRELEPKSYHARLVESVGCPAWDHHGREAQWKSDIQNLAAEMLSKEQLLRDEADWLTSVDASSAFDLGLALGTLDAGAGLLDLILRKSLDRELALLRGYLAGLIQGHRKHAVLLNERIDQMELRAPLIAFQMALAAGTVVHVFDRAVRLVRNRAIPPYNLRNFTFWVGDVRVTNEQVMTAIELLLPYAEAGDLSCCDVLIDFLGSRLHAGEFPALIKINPEPIWNALRIATKHPGAEVFWWAQTLSAAAPTHPALAIQLASAALLGNNFQMSDEADALLCQFAVTHPKEVMDELGRVMFDNSKGWHFFVDKYAVIGALPPEIVIAWLEKAGVEGARRIARHMPQPHLAADGSTVVPKLTAYVLERFENDDHTFAEFCAGTHSLQTYTGDIATARETEAQHGRVFLNHRLRRIREWGSIEYKNGKADAQRHREWEDESGLQ